MQLEIIRRSIVPAQPQADPMNPRPIEPQLPLPFEAEEFLQRVARAPKSVLLLDYDGTLAPFCRERDKALPYEGVVETLRSIMENGRSRIVVVTGRDAREIPLMLNLHPHPEVWGLHGRQRLSGDDTVETAAPSEKEIEALDQARAWLDYQQLHHVAEYKSGSTAVHWRGILANDASAIRERVLLGWRSIAAESGLHILEFDGGVEIGPPQPNKGHAVRSILLEMDEGSPAAYLGDDSTDETAFMAMRGRGLSVLVSAVDRPTAAQIRLQPPDEVLTFLQKWLQACQSPQSAQSDQGKAAGANQ